MQFMYVIKIIVCEISFNKGLKFKFFMWEDGFNLWIVCYLVYKQIVVYEEFYKYYVIGQFDL